MERLVVFRLEYADLSRKFSSSFVLRDQKRVANSWRRMAVRVRAIAGLLVCWRNASIFVLAPYIRHLAPFLILQVDRTGSLSPCLAAGKLQQHRNRIL
jgi:hypothetical protein